MHYCSYLFLRDIYFAEETGRYSGDGHIKNATDRQDEFH